MLIPPGIGICAIHVAKWLGAEIYATVSSEDKAAFLVKEFGISRNRIFQSRDSSFVQDIMEATHGSGIDLVLNSLSGELQSASWNCVALDGAMIEIGKRDSECPFLISIYDQEGASPFSGVRDQEEVTTDLEIKMSTASRLLLAQPPHLRLRFNCNVCT